MCTNFSPLSKIRNKKYTCIDNLFVLCKAAIEVKQLLDANVRAYLGVRGQRAHELEVSPHLVRQARLATQLGHEVHKLRHAGADVALLGARDQQRLAAVLDPDVIFLKNTALLVLVPLK